MRGARRRPLPELSPLDRRRPRDAGPSTAGLQSQSPAAAREHGQHRQPPGGAGWPQPPLQGGLDAAVQQGPEAGQLGEGRAGILARLWGLAEGGAVVPLPFVRAADLGAPAALLNDLRAAYLPPDKAHLLGNLVRTSGPLTLRPVQTVIISCRLHC